MKPKHGLDEAKAGIKIAGRNISNLRYEDDITLVAESKEELKSFLMKVKEESEKVGLKLNIQKMKITASGPITSWQRDGKGYPLQYSAVENSMVCIALGVTKSQTQRCDFTLEHLDGTGCHDLHFLNVEF